MLVPPTKITKDVTGKVAYWKDVEEDVSWGGVSESLSS